MTILEALLVNSGFILSLLGLSVYSTADDKLNRVIGLLMLWGGVWLGIIGVWLGQ